MSIDLISVGGKAKMHLKSFTMDDVSGVSWEGIGQVGIRALSLCVCAFASHMLCDYFCGSFFAFWQFIIVMVWSSPSSVILLQMQGEGGAILFPGFSPTHSTVIPTDIRKGLHRPRPQR